MKIKAVNFYDYISSLLNSMKPMADQKKIQLYFQHPPQNVEVSIDPDQFEKVVLNLMSNAIKFTGEGGRIYINVELKDYKYWINVIDTGIGIPKTKYEQIFDQFYQVEPSLTRKYQGMGIGLSIAKGMVEIHKGRIWVKSVVGKGCNFTVVLPTAPDVA